MLKLVKPTFEELWFREQLLADEETMAFNRRWGGTITFDQEAWYQRWIRLNDSKRYYRYLQNEEGNYVGEVAYHYCDHYQGYMINIIILAKYRRKGYGSEGLELLCKAAKDHGIVVVYDDIAADNPACSMFERHGFIIKEKSEEIILLYKEL